MFPTLNLSYRKFSARSMNLVSTTQVPLWDFDTSDFQGFAMCDIQARLRCQGGGTDESDDFSDPWVRICFEASRSNPRRSGIAEPEFWRVNFDRLLRFRRLASL